MSTFLSDKYGVIYFNGKKSGFFLIKKLYHKKPKKIIIKIPKLLTKNSVLNILDFGNLGDNLSIAIA